MTEGRPYDGSVDAAQEDADNRSPGADPGETSGEHPDASVGPLQPDRPIRRPVADAPGPVPDWPTPEQVDDGARVTMDLVKSVAAVLRIIFGYHSERDRVSVLPLAEEHGLLQPGDADAYRDGFYYDARAARQGVSQDQQKRDHDERIERVNDLHALLASVRVPGGDR